MLSDDALYDIAAVAAIQGSLIHAEALYFELPADLPEGERLVDLVESRLRTRVMSGSLESIPDALVSGHGGRFSGPNGSLWWVELWDFREAAPGTPGSSTTLLVYVSIW